MASLTIKNVPDKLYRKLKRTAAENRRSLNNEIIVLLERVVQPERPPLEEFLERAKRLRAYTAGHLLTDEEVTRMKNEGRK